MSAEQQPMPMRLKNAAIFVGIVWALAASFVAFELLALFGTSRALPFLGDLALSPATTRSTVCERQANEAVAPRSLNDPAALSISWQLGVAIGRAAQSHQAGTIGADPVADAVADVARLAGKLGVSVPGPFAPRRIASADTEFVWFVEDDTAGTAGQLAQLYSRDACEAYKLGAFWGYSTHARVRLRGDQSIHAVEIKHYGRRLSLPDELIQAMIAPPPADAAPGGLANETAALANALTEHFATSSQVSARSTDSPTKARVIQKP